MRMPMLCVACGVDALGARAALRTLGALCTLTLVPTRQLPTLGTVYAARNVVDMDEDAFKSLVQQDRRMPPAPIWSLGQK